MTGLRISVKFVSFILPMKKPEREMTQGKLSLPEIKVGISVKLTAKIFWRGTFSVTI